MDAVDHLHLHPVARAVGAQGLDRNGFFLYCISIALEPRGDELVGFVL